MASSSAASLGAMCLTDVRSFRKCRLSDPRAVGRICIVTSVDRNRRPSMPHCCRTPATSLVTVMLNHRGPSMAALTAARRRPRRDRRRASAARGCARTVSASRARSGARIRDDTYWGRPVPGFGDPRARLLIVGLAPAAHGANRTGRVFTGDGVGGSGDFLMAALHRAGFANMPTSQHPRRRADAARRVHRRGRALRAAGQQADAGGDRPLPAAPRRRARRAAARVGRRRARQDRVRRVPAAARSSGASSLRPRPQFGHGVAHRLPNGQTLIGCYHPSRQNTNTGKLTAAMMDTVFQKVRGNFGVTQASKFATMARRVLFAVVSYWRRPQSWLLPSPRREGRILPQDAGAGPTAMLGTFRPNTTKSTFIRCSAAFRIPGAWRSCLMAISDNGTRRHIAARAQRRSAALARSRCTLCALDESGRPPRRRTASTVPAENRLAVTTMLLEGARWRDHDRARARTAGGRRARGPAASSSTPTTGPKSDGNIGSRLAFLCDGTLLMTTGDRHL